MESYRNQEKLKKKDYLDDDEDEEDEEDLEDEDEDVN